MTLAEVKFDLFDPRYFVVKRKGKVVRTSASSCSYATVFGSKGFKSGVHKWKIKVISRVHGSTEQVGVVTSVHKDAACSSKQITNCGGISSGTGLGAGDIVQIVLDFKKLKVTFYKNKNLLKSQGISKKTKYYPAITCCCCANQHFELVK